MTHSPNKSLVSRYYEELWNAWDLTLVDSLLDPGFRFRGSLGALTSGTGEFREYMATVRSAFPDFHNSLDAVIAEGDLVAVRLTYRGTHRGKLFDLPPTGRRIQYSGAGFYRGNGERLTEGWILGDMLSLLEQLGAIR